MADGYEFETKRQGSCCQGSIGMASVHIHENGEGFTCIVNEHTTLGDELGLAPGYDLHFPTIEAAQMAAAEYVAEQAEETLKAARQLQVALVGKLDTVQKHVKFLRDMERGGEFEIRENYRGRGGYAGPAVVVDAGDEQEIYRLTVLRLTRDSMGKNRVVLYPR